MRPELGGLAWHAEKVDFTLLVKGEVLQLFDWINTVRIKL